MVNECKPDIEGFEWAIFLFNVMGEDSSYFMHLYKVQKRKKRGKLGEDIVDFPNDWKMRIKNEEIAPIIDTWYTEAEPKLDSLPETLTEVNLNDDEVKKTTIDLYLSL